jgi:phosphoribosylformimino-5-aminoimidazole carboxamide ribotide isomerase
MTRFRPCIDLHAGSVKQIVGGTLSDTAADALKTNFTSEHPSAYYASLYKENNLTGAHVIMLGPGNDKAAKEALEAWKGGMQVGGGITEKNAREWVENGAEKVSSPLCTLHLN